jgi:hypothetical protein
MTVPKTTDSPTSVPEEPRRNARYHNGFARSTFRTGRQRSASQLPNIADSSMISALPLLRTPFYGRSAHTAGLSTAPTATIKSFVAASSFSDSEQSPTAPPEVDCRSSLKARNRRTSHPPSNLSRSRMICPWESASRVPPPARTRRNRHTHVTFEERTRTQKRHRTLEPSQGPPARSGLTDGSPY